MSARNTDPVSSHITAAEVKAEGRTRAQQRDCLILLYFYQSATGKGGTRSELADRYAKSRWAHHKGDPELYKALVTGSRHIMKAQLGRRLPELRDHGLVTSDEIRRCSVANRASQVWQLSSIGEAAAIECVSRPENACE